jgi:hypothetical protein
VIIYHQPLFGELKENFRKNNMKKIIKKRVLECVIEQQKIIAYGKVFPYDFNGRLSKILELREKYVDIIPITNEMKQDVLDYINALNDENYETCINFFIE